MANQPLHLTGGRSRFGFQSLFLSAHPQYRTNGQLRFNAVVLKGTDLRRIQAFIESCDLFDDSMGLEISRQKQAGAQAGPIPPDDPLAEVTTYARSLSSITGGRGSYTMELSHYDIVPGNVVQEIVAKAQMKEEEEE